jgi:nickel/cobalt transporter (NicO) family protein
MTETLAPALALAAATVGALHALAPDHWLPIAAVSRARGWSVGRTARVALLCGFGHVTVSALLGVLALVSGSAVVEAFGARSASVAGILLIGFGAAYGLWGLRKLAHHHAHAERDPSRTTVWTLFAIYCADPCIAVVPIVFAAASLSRAATVTIVVVYELATIGTMVALTALARAGASRLHGRWVERYGDATAGGLIVATGVLVALIGW